MRKLFLLAVLIFIIIGFFPQKIASTETASSFQVIPDDAIRLRILANSDSEQDQALKHKVRDEINKEVTKWVEKMDDINEARALIASRITELEAIVDKVLASENSNYTYNVEYSKSVTFPTKLYGDYLYPEGEYEAILVTLGEGEGSNWWCVVFPPLCFLDFSFGTTVEAAETEEPAEEVEEEPEEEEEVKYTFFFVEWFQSFFA
ncbi:stage II sporulation protein R [Gracilibacillus oryzae]|uniref:Stage II sporulation protein R n=1 Tax=Gracilibacillus oryzae TaxID=1672701 RepID=A0A7C8GRQ0_9BACI|nr:stage II sporulation protein R [Gracilibacillus oryzae]KAB8127175.1 stage II sporulation protein R [Gracilibacillus oryzae]